MEALPRLTNFVRLLGSIQRKLQHDACHGEPAHNVVGTPALFGRETLFLFTLLALPEHNEEGVFHIPKRTLR
jgi:hypothetical protein